MHRRPQRAGGADVTRRAWPISQTYRAWRKAWLRAWREVGIHAAGQCGECWRIDDAMNVYGGAR
jgi:hypothetical protein